MRPLTHGLETTALLHALALKVRRFPVGAPLARGNEVLIVVSGLAIAASLKEVAEIEIEAVASLLVLNHFEIIVAVGIVCEEGPRDVYFIF